ncbi:uncharacterized protein METZ01_LOCUS57877 [marine metagenome]|uniref:ribonuclease H n=1 Tax=marine metagenome TaxID=408172 RepID=A0A381SUJ4_9ZZZZ
MISGTHSKSMHGGTPNTTNNRMELTAAIKALNTLKKSSKVTLFTDSKYVMDGINKYIEVWKDKGWKKSNNKKVKNKDLWQALDQATSNHDISWEWVRGHTGDPGNEEADRLANLGIDELDGGF